MSPAAQYSEDTTSKSLYLNGDIPYDGKRSSVQSNESIYSLESLSSSPNDRPNGLVITGRSSKSDFLNKIKYFEKRTDQEQPELHKVHSSVNTHGHKSAFKEALEEVRSNFPKEDYKLHVKLDENISVSRNDSVRKIGVRVMPPQPVPKRFQYEPEKQKPIKPEAIIEESQPKEIVKEERKNKKPVRELSIRETVNEVRSQFADNERRSSNLNLEDLTSDCGKFFSTSDTKFLPDESSQKNKHFTIILKGNLYDNRFYSFNGISVRAHYYLHDFFDYDLFTATELFDPWAM